jgi:hypothetical protein
VGKQKVPLLHQMIRTKVADTQTYLLFAAVGLMILGKSVDMHALFYVGTLLLAFSILLVVYNVIYTFNYTIKE